MIKNNIAFCLRQIYTARGFVRIFREDWLYAILLIFPIAYILPMIFIYLLVFFVLNH